MAMFGETVREIFHESIEPMLDALDERMRGASHAAATARDMAGEAAGAARRGMSHLPLGSIAAAAAAGAVAGCVAGYVVSRRRATGGAEKEAAS